MAYRELGMIELREVVRRSLCVRMSETVSPPEITEEGETG
jgi:hypothetical protein